jgi:CheY-like chemotaxis protein
MYMEQLRGCRILVIDDEAELLEYIESLLRKAGMIVDATPSARAALELVRTKPYDLILTDARTSEVRSAEMLTHLREHHRGPIVLLTGLLDDEITSLIESLNLFGVIEKPFDKNRLLEVLGRARSS